MGCRLGNASRGIWYFAVLSCAFISDVWGFGPGQGRGPCRRVAMWDGSLATCVLGCVRGSKSRRGGVWCSCSVV
ncbi:hypothetical protein QBC34DRAFT_390605 [Podospora aff. communis PSN243]|uniref:Secreted protein n=1 Tax=Podospora aff. communis PSN243 TaxID=3040156 RepID=A0AAV9H877_9PEZI|nr:hypothetical protein QBC34DRAFT_390605 [Podospora aff. communis PSN243]